MSAEAAVALPERKQTWRDLARGEIAKGVPPDTVTSLVLDAMEDVDLREVARALLYSEIRLMVCERRRITRGPAGESRRYDAVDFLTVQYCVGGTFKQLGELTRAECVSVADDYFRLAAENKSCGDGFTRLAALMRKRKAKLVKNLPGKELVEVMAA